MVLMKGKRAEGQLYVLQGGALVDEANFIQEKKMGACDLWHHRLGHISKRGIEVLQKQDLLLGDKIDDMSFCEHCTLGKAHKVKFSIGTHNSQGMIYWGLHCLLDCPGAKSPF